VPECVKEMNKTIEIRWEGNPMAVPGVDDESQIGAIREIDAFFSSRPNHLNPTANHQKWSKSGGILHIQRGNVTHISFRMRGLLKLPETSLAKLPHLKYIDLDFNHLDQYPNILTELEKLETVRVFGNWLPQDFIYVEGQTAFVDVKRLRESRSS